ncbi:hypothetical protein DIPPA_08004 [Diplonema papillatum]|nr:hypothetical protein DIPPA_08004 [Diplonema papillatum]
MASIRKMVLTGARISNKTVDVLDGDRHDLISRRNNWSWYDVENAHMSPVFFQTHWGHPKHPWYAGEYKNLEGYRHFGGVRSTEARHERRGMRGKWTPAFGFGKKALEAKKLAAKAEMSKKKK